MQKFLIKVLLFLVPVVVGAYLLDTVVTKAIRRSQGGTVKVWDDVLEGRLNSDIWVCGSSRALNHIDPEILHDSLGVNTYNLGMSGQSLLMIKSRYEVAIEHNKVPKVVILTVDLNTLTKGKDLFEYRYFASVLNEPIVKSAAKQYSGGFDVFDYNLPLVRYIGYTKELKDAARFLISGKRNTDIIYAKGYHPHNESWNGDFEKAKATMKMYRVGVDSPTLVLFKAYIEETKKANVKLVFVYTPEYKDAASFIENKQDLIALYQSYSKQYDIPFLDYSNDTLCNDKQYFFNSLHLNLVGATIFSKQLSHDIKALGVL